MRRTTQTSNVNAPRRSRAATIAIAGIAAAVVASAPGCAAIFRGTTQTVTIRTDPPGRSVHYQGLEITDGSAVSIRKRAEEPRVYVGAWSRELSYEPDPLLIADAALLVVFVIPGIVALGIDFATGAWRDLDDVQRIYVPDPPQGE